MHHVHHKLRRSRLFSFPGFSVRRDIDGRLGFTRLHEKGHVNTQAAIASVLLNAANARSYPSDHAIFIDRVRQLRKRGTWL